MNYNNHYAVFTNKVKEYDVHTCTRALYDCHDTLALWGDKIDSDYAVRLWAEIDALRDRQLALQKKIKVTARYGTRVLAEFEI
jgi:hypothetical protein